MWPRIARLNIGFFRVIPFTTLTGEIIMDFGATISRAFRIMWDNKVLWILGFLAALGGGGTGGNFQGPQFTNRLSSSNLAPFAADPSLILAGASLFFCLI